MHDEHEPDRLPRRLHGVDLDARGVIVHVVPLGQLDQPAMYIRRPGVPQPAVAGEQPLDLAVRVQIRPRVEDRDVFEPGMCGQGNDGRSQPELPTADC